MKFMKNKDMKDILSKRLRTICSGTGRTEHRSPCRVMFWPEGESTLFTFKIKRQKHRVSADMIQKPEETGL
jgi:hypothetical protein